MKLNFKCGNLLIAVVVGCLSVTETKAAPVISEFAANKEGGILDEDLTVQDWIEIHNPTPLPIDLNNWCLTDTAGNLTRWRFPAVTLGAGDFMVVYASGKNRRIPGQPLHSNFSLKNEGEYLALVQPDGVTVVQQYAPEYPPQNDSRSYGLVFTRTNLVPEGASAQYGIPTNASALSVNWKTAVSTPAGWSTGQTGVGFGMAVPGFSYQVRGKNLDMGGLWSQADAEALLALPTGHTNILNEARGIVPVMNILGEGSDGHFGNNQTLPLWAADHYVYKVSGTITIPTAGPWTFGLNSDDGSRIAVDGTTVMDDPTLHGPEDHFGTVTLTAGAHAIEAWYWEAGGGDEGELFAAAGTFTAWSDSMRLVGDTANGGLAVVTTLEGGETGAGNPVRTDVEAEMLNRNASAFLRVRFDAMGAGQEGSLHLQMRYNDGFVAYLNGLELVRTNAPASLAWNSTATTSRTASQSLQPQAFNGTAVLASLMPTGNILAIHGLNVSDSDITFLALPELVLASVAEPLASGFFETATPGGINTPPDSLGKVLDPAYSPDRGVYPDATVTNVPFYVALSTPTPGATIRFTTDGSTPTETNGAPYTGPIRIAQTTVLRAMARLDGWEDSKVDTHTYVIPDDVIAQSPTGAPPGPTWPVPDGSGRVNGHVIDYGMDPDIVNHADPALGGPERVKAALRAIPSVCVATDLSNLFDSATGIYVNPYGRGLAWERPCSIELLNDPCGGFQVNAGIRVRGGYSRSYDNPKHAFRFFFRGEYGAGTLDYPVFGTEGAEVYDKIDLRTSQNYSWSFAGDSHNTFLREEFSRQAFIDMGWPGSHVKYAHLYVNGHYWGLFDFDERIEADHCETYLGGDASDWDVVKAEQESGYITSASDGSLDAWNALFAAANPLVTTGEYVRRALTDAEYYDMQGLGPDGIATNASPVLLDVDALIDYMLLTFWMGNLDGATSAFLGDTRANNWYGVRDRTGARGFLFFPHDFEHTMFNVYEDRTGPFTISITNQASYEEKRAYYNPMFLHSDLMDVEAYRHRWWNRVQRYLFNGGALDLAANTARFNRLADQVDSAIAAESARWGDAKTEPPLTRANWVWARDEILNNYLPQRTVQVLAQLRADGLYPPLDGVLASPPGGFMASNSPLGLTGPSAPGVTLYYTLDGSDPRLEDGSVNPAAQVFTPGGTVSNTLVGSGEEAAGATWKYRDPSIDLGSSDIVAGHPSYGVTNWKHPDYDDANAAIWKSGDAELGDGDAGDGRPERTLINIGPSDSRFPVVYFRKQFVVENPSQYESLDLKALIDDGAIFYINGQEAARLNLPTGAMGYDYSGAGAINEAVFIAVADPRLLPGLLIDGTNQFAVQVHNASASSSDLGFDLQLCGRTTVFADPVLLPPGEGRVLARAFDGAQWSALSDFTFLVDAEAATASNLVVSEIQYNPAVSAGDTALGYSDDTFFEYLELQNIGPLRVDLMGLRFIHGMTWAFDRGASVPRLLLPGGRVILAGHRAAYEHRHGLATPLAGVYSGQLSNGGETLTLIDGAGAVVRDFAYDDDAPWPVEPDGTGASLVLIRPSSNPDHADPLNWRASLGSGNPGSSDALEYETWKAANAPGQGDFTDVDLDGVPLYWEYVHGGNPAQADPGRWISLVKEGEAIPVLRFDLRAGADDAVVIPEVGADLAGWDSAGVLLLQHQRQTGGTDRLSFAVRPPYSAASLLFFRLRSPGP